MSSGSGFATVTPGAMFIASVQFGDVTPGRVVNTKEIAEEYNIPLELLAKVLQALAKNGMIESHNGPKGGYLLARSARQITISQVLESIEGPLGITDCSHEKDGEFCMQREHCNIRTPLLILHPEDDHRCPVSQGEELFTAPAVLDREVEMVRFVGESHGLSRCGRPHNRLERLRRILDWFERKL